MDLETLLSELLSEIQNSSSLDPVSYQYYNQLLNHRTIILNKIITENIIETVYLPLKDFEEDDSMAPVTLILNSIGGSVTDGFFLAHYLTKYSKPLKIIITGCAASMAAVILAGGGKNPNVTRYCYPSSYGLIHDGYITFDTSETKTAEDILAFNSLVDKDIKQFIIDNTKITQEQYEQHTRQQWFLTASEMAELGLIDKIIGVDEE